jgi:hypothetical protein
MQVPFLLLSGFEREPNSIRRGIAVQLCVLCRELGTPAISTPIPALAPNQTNRERISTFTDSCGFGCHREYINPLGFAFESFDGLGQERRIDNGSPVDTSGSYPFAEGVKDFADAKELMSILAKSERAHTCYAKKITGYALQRDLVEQDSALVETLAKGNGADSIKELVVSLVESPAFRVREAGNP